MVVLIWQCTMAAFIACLKKKKELGKIKKNKQTTKTPPPPPPKKKRNGLNEHSETKSCCIENADEPGTGNED